MEKDGGIAAFQRVLLEALERRVQLYAAEADRWRQELAARNAIENAPRI